MPTNEPEITVVAAKPDDALGITTVLYKTWLATYPNEESGITTQDIEDSYKDAFTEVKIQGLQKKIASSPPNEKRLVAKHGEIIVGVATITVGKDANEIKTIYVLPESQGKGIGTKLWEEMQKFSDPTKDTVLSVATYSQKTIEFYKKLGFVDTGKRSSDGSWRMQSAGISMPQMEMIRKAS